MTELDVDPESNALQYRILETGGQWVLEPAYPEFPRTPDENLAILEAHRILPADGAGRFVVPEDTRDRLEAEPGDVVSLVTAVAVHATVFVDDVSDALEPIHEAMEEAAAALAEAFAGIFEDPADGRGQDDRDARLPEHIREARARRDQQREQARGQAGRDWLESDE